MKRQVLVIISVVFATLLGAAPTGAGATTAVSQTQAVSEQSDAIPPVVVVLDLSGSMNDDDGTGLIKLTGAKKAVDEVIRSVPASQPFGLWTYPGGSDECSSGSYTITPARITDLNGTIAKADALTADGGTPTGPALQSTADALTAQDTRTATLVLVSDGESNCGDNPCDVAKQLASKRFDVTIHAVGFRVSDKGRDELNCVASATGGTYVDVDNGVQLNKTLRDLTRANLRLQTAGILNPLAGLPARITVTVSNQSAVTASDAQVVLQLDGDTPANLNTILRVGNMPPGARFERTWTVGTGIASLTSSTGTAGNVDDGRKFTVSAWAKNADRVSVDGVIGASGSDSGHYLGDWLRKPIEAGHPFVILGDSYSAGEGTFDYVLPPSGVSEDCHRSDKTYLIPEFDPGEVVNLACSGAVSWDFYYTAPNGTPPQLQQLADLEQTPGAVVMTLGGNDIGFKPIVAECISLSCGGDARKLASWYAAVDSLRPWLAPVYEDVWKTINLPERRNQRAGAYAPVIVLAYPQVTHATQYGACELGWWSEFDAGSVRVANQLVARLNAQIKAAVEDARNSGYEVYFVPDTADITLPDHTVCNGDGAYINGIRLLNIRDPANDVAKADFAAVKSDLAKPESIHPNVSGYAAETGAIIGWSATVTPEGPDTSANGPKPTRVASEPWALLTFDTTEIRLSRQATVDGSLFNGAPILISGTGYEPGTPVIILIHSTTAVLGTLVADENGDIRGQVRVPGTLELGQHQIVASGTNSDGTYREDRVAVTVLAPPPLWVQLALPGAGALLLAAMVFGSLCWRERRRQRV